jgi:pimeloyl-ACP methyl ester carboxylesterase
MAIASANGIRISYDVAGHGEPLVMIMGFTAPRRGWTAQIPFFLKYYRTITFDNRGIGKSDKPPGPYSTRMMAEDTIGLMDYLEIAQAHVIGASMGGMIAQELAINYPQRVKKLVLACTYARLEGTGGDASAQAKLDQLAPQEMARAMIGLALNRPVYRLTFGLLAAIQSRFVGASGRVGIAGQLEACRKHNTLERLKLIAAPTLVMVGSEDRIIKPVSSEVIAGRIAGARLVKVPGGSHSFSFEMKNVFNREVLSFLST